MSVTTTQCIRKPLYVDAVRITGANFDEIATWCQGEIQQDEVPGKGTGKKYIRVRVHNPKNPRQTKAFVGDWILYTERGYKIYTNKAFHASFDEVGTVEESVSYPYADGDTTVLGPECFVSQDGTVLSWKGVNYVPQSELEFVPATPEAIAQAVLENEAAQTAEEDVALEEQRGEGLAGPEREYPEETTIGGTPRDDINVGVRAA